MAAHKHESKLDRFFQSGACVGDNMVDNLDKHADKNQEQSLSDDLQSLFGYNLRSERTTQNLTQQELGDLANFGKQYIGRIENGQINVTLSTMNRLAVALGKNVQSFLKSPNAS